MGVQRKKMNNILKKIGAILSAGMVAFLCYAYFILVPEYIPRQMFNVDAFNDFILSGIILFTLLCIGFILTLVKVR